MDGSRSESQARIERHMTAMVPPISLAVKSANESNLS